MTSPDCGVSAWLLDVDDTLLDTAAAMRLAAPGAVGALCPQLASDDVDRIAAVYCVDPDGAFLRFAQGQIGLAASRGQRLRAAFDMVGVPLPAEAADLTAWGSTFDVAFRPRLLAELRVFDDVVPALEAALAAGVTVGLLTNASESLTRAKLQRTVLSTFPFVCVVTRDTLGFGKPDARVFRHAASLAAPGCALGSVLYVGDDVVVDATSATEAGLRGVLIERADPAEGAPTVERVRTLVDLPTH